MNSVVRAFLKTMQRLHHARCKRRCAGRTDNLLSGMSLDRLPDAVARTMPRGIRFNQRFPAGKTLEVDAEGKALVVEVFYAFRQILPGMDNQGTSGIDVYIRGENGQFAWRDTLAPPNSWQMCVRRRIPLAAGTNRLRFYLPSFAAVEGLYLSSCTVARIEGSQRADIVAYGSSITQGCAASRPGLSYVNQIANRLGCTVANYGFSASARGEEKLLRHIASLCNRVFIMEYDHNASAQELQSTHLKAYLAVRSRFSGWIILLSRFSGGLSITPEEESRRVGVIRRTYGFARESGDARVVFYDGSRLLQGDKEAYFADRVHPNDRGMTAIAEMLCAMIAEEDMLT